MAQVIDGVTAPSGGFQQGGWYSGRQYWNGTLSAPGVINSQSDQIGAGKAVSNEVLKATSIAAGKAPDANQKYIAAETKKYNSAPSAPAAAPAFDLGSYLNDYQSSIYGAGGISGVAASLLPEGKAPEPINRAAMYETQRTEMGVEGLETELNDIKTQERELLAQVRATQIDEEGKPVALSVMGGRVTEEKRQAQIDLDFLNVRKATLVDELTTKYNAINMYINFAGLDYQDAKEAYDSEFSRNLELAKFISGEQQNAITNARANLTTVMNLVTSGNMSYGDLSNDEKLQISKLEVQSGLPIGTISKLQIAPNDKILGFSDDKSQVMMLDGSGGFKVVSTGITASGGKTTEAEFTRAASSEMSGWLSEKSNPSGHVNQYDYDYARKKWTAATGGTAKMFDDMFRGFRDPYNQDQYNLVANDI